MTAAPTPVQRRFLRGLASHGGGWWSADSLAAAWPADFAEDSRQMLSGAGRACVKGGWAQSRKRSTHERAWMEYRITDAGREQVADSCLGGGLRWVWLPTEKCVTCPACGTTGSRQLTGSTIPAHPLPAVREKARP